MAVATRRKRQSMSLLKLNVEGREKYIPSHIPQCGKTRFWSLPNCIFRSFCHPIRGLSRRNSELNFTQPDMSEEKHAMPRIRDFSVTPGYLQPGQWNAIT